MTDGEVAIGDTLVTDMPPRDRDVAMVFQNYALYPHMTVAENLSIGLRLRRRPKTEVHDRVAEVAHILGLDPLLERRPAELSGGQRQRVAMGRAMVREPQAFLMDEPLSNLDAKLRVQMRAELARIRDRVKTTTLYVTHDQVEAMTLGDRVAVMRDGVVQQLDTPQNLFRHPANLFVAAFIGSPSMNLLEARIEQGNVCFADHRIPVTSGADLSAYDGRTVVLGIRPGDFEDAAVWHDDARPEFEVEVDVSEELGDQVNVIFRLDAPPAESDAVRDASDPRGGRRRRPRPARCRRGPVGVHRVRRSAHLGAARRQGAPLGRPGPVSLLRHRDRLRDRRRRPPRAGTGLMSKHQPSQAPLASGCPGTARRSPESTASSPLTRLVDVHHRPRRELA